MSKHQKALSSPKSYPIGRKERPWTLKPRAGPHPKDDSIPLGIVVRDMLGYVDNVSEVKEVLEKGLCKVDGKVVRDHRLPLGTFDSLQLGDEYFRLMPSEEGFELVGVDEADSGKKVCRVEDKKTVKGGKIQLNLNDGKNIVVDKKRLKKLPTGSSLVLSLPELEIEEVIEFEEGQEAMVTGGKNRGKVAELQETKELKGSKENRVVVSSNGDELDLPEKLVFPVNEEMIKLRDNHDE
ncbi:MAG: 30S ribosomal protein S4e [Candidatus Aenigmatarchaeota archaeon]